MMTEMKIRIPQDKDGCYFRHTDNVCMVAVEAGATKNCGTTKNCHSLVPPPYDCPLLTGSVTVTMREE